MPQSSFSDCPGSGRTQRVLKAMPTTRQAIITRDQSWSIVHTDMSQAVSVVFIGTFELVTLLLSALRCVDVTCPHRDRGQV